VFKHFILTRFNLKIEGYAAIDKNGQPVQTDKWLERRFYLFENFCLPSLMNQTCKNFIWFVLFSNDTPAVFIEKIKEFQMNFPLLKPLFLPQGDNKEIIKNIKEELPKYLEGSDEYIITTRIDNDDAFQRDMICEIQEFFRDKNDFFLSFTYGLQYDIKNKIMTRLHYHNNHFVSRIEKLSKNVVTVFTCDHTNIDRVSEVVYVENKSKPLWLEVIHEGNLINNIYPDAIPVLGSRCFFLFGFKEDLSVKGTLLLFLKYFYRRLLLFRAYILKKLTIYDQMKTLLHKD
jgi:hypothetical protein